MMFSSMRSRHRELGLLAALTVMALALGLIVARDVRQSADDAGRLFGRLSSGLDLIDALEFNTQEVRRILLYALHTSDANLQLHYAEQSRAAEARVQELLDTRSDIVSSPPLSVSVDAVERAWNQYLVARDEVIGLILEGSLSEGVALDEQHGLTRFTDVREAIAALKASFALDAAAQVQAARTRADRATLRLTLIVFNALAAAAVGLHLVNRRAALEGLLRSEAHKGSILQAVPDPIISVDAAGHVFELNEAAERTFGVTRGEALGAPVEQIILPTEGYGLLASFFSNGQSASRAVLPRIQTSGQRRDGTKFPMELAAVTHRAGRDRIWTLHINDLTERRQAEQELRRAKDAAEAADHAKSEFLATMSHELRTPLTGVVGIADLLKGAELPAPQRDLIRMLRSSATSLLGLVNDILDYTRIESGLMDLMPAPFPVRSCVEGAFDSVTEIAARKGLDLGYLIDADVPVTVVADEARVRQVLLNLVSNAVKFTDQGEVAVHVSATTGHDDAVTIHMSVRDSGRGIPDSLRHKLFQRFSQIEEGRRREHEGAGLGLAISQSLSRLLGGSLSVESQPGLGSTFTFDFIARRAHEASTGDDPERSLTGVRVLALLGRGIVADQIESLLAGWGASATVVTDDSEAMSPAADGVFDAVVVDADARDQHLPIRALRHRMRSRGIAASMVIVMRPGPAHEAGIEPTDRVVAKPVRADPLYEAVRGAAGGPLSGGPQHDEQDELAFVRGSLAILLVEDNDANRHVVRLMLEELGLTPDEAAGGQDAITRASAREYDVILMDVQMPGIDGFDATRRIRAQVHGRPPTIIGLTANVMRGDEARCRHAGMDGYLMKPLRLQTLAAVLRPLTRAQS